MSADKSCECSVAPKLIFACSGAADVGALADQAARKLTQDGIGKMFCLAGVGGRVPGIMKSTEAAAAEIGVDLSHCGSGRQAVSRTAFRTRTGRRGHRLSCDCRLL